ncbi:alpha-amylase family protein [Rudaeicoccus suwonensis]|uniref:Cyclomaltodextrinase n=1 Tax=Rudaeicoccus suwonensis TaxID=657409 RepID=A0A561ECP4_9MICO|nr:alpha-amylase family protein [Rudaeicoccus suwonensis]TWE13369.1 cyclomaltodextrinase [Rudaeicoccus suwonensis]
MTEPQWVRHSIWWHVYPLGFVGADITGRERHPSADALGHPRTMRALIDWLDYIVDVGLNAIALGPIFRSATHGYDTLDFFDIDERLGTIDDFSALVSACHARGVRIMLDGVFNHVGRDFPCHESLTKATVFEGHEQLVELDHDNPAVADLVVDVMVHWADQGIDAWRLDAAYSVNPEFWATVLPRVRERHPQLYVVGEVLHGDYPDMVEASGMDSCTQYELWKAIWSGLLDRNMFELEWSLRRHNELLLRFVPWTFVGNHDVTRLASRLDDQRLLPHALVLLMTIGGTPAIYYGDEQAFRGIKEERVGGDDEIRPAFPAKAEDLAPFGWPIYRLTQRLVALRRQHPWLHRASSATVHLTNEEYAYRVEAEGHSLTIVLNLKPVAVTIPVPGPRLSAVVVGSAGSSAGFADAPDIPDVAGAARTADEGRASGDVVLGDVLRCDVTPDVVPRDVDLSHVDLSDVDLADDLHRCAVVDDGTAVVVPAYGWAICR